MKIRVLDAATQDLVEGFRFYEKQETGLGQYFLDSLFADIDSLQLNAGILPFGLRHFTGYWQNVFLLLFTTKSKMA